MWEVRLFMRNCELYERQNALSIIGIYRTIFMICRSQGASSFIRQQYPYKDGRWRLPSGKPNGCRTNH